MSDLPNYPITQFPNYPITQFPNYPMSKVQLVVII